MRSFLDDRNFFLQMVTIIIAVPVFGILISSCGGPETPEEKVEVDMQYAEKIKSEIVVFSPRPGVECYVLRGYSSTNPRLMSCVGTVPITMGQ
jgi:hypothetical protein